MSSIIQPRISIVLEIDMKAAKFWNLTSGQIQDGRRPQIFNSKIAITPPRIV